MTDSTAISSEKESCLLLGISERRSRKCGCSNIFSGINTRQLQRLFQTTGDRDTEHKARLVWRGEDDEDDIYHTDAVKGGQGTEEDAGLAQALVTLRICARTKAGFRAEGPTREQKWYRASPHMLIKEPFSGYSVMKDDISSMTHNLPFLKEEKNSETPNKSSSWKFGVVRHKSANGSERYLHQILH